MDGQLVAETSARYRRFADEAARRRSPLYERLARGVARDTEVIAFLLKLPEEKRQPNLLLAAVRHLFGTPADWIAFRQAIRQAFVERVMALSQYWISNESPRVLPEVAARAKEQGPIGRFLLSVNGFPVAWTDPHGGAIEWIAAKGQTFNVRGMAC